MDDARARELLTEHRQRIERSLASTSRTEDGELDEQSIDVDKRLQDEGVDDALAEDLREHLAAIERAERRLEEGTYGISIESGERIADGRLEAIPWAERTAEEQQHHDLHH